jgi:hypothetical protein
MRYLIAIRVKIRMVMETPVNKLTGFARSQAFMVQVGQNIMLGTA